MEEFINVMDSRFIILIVLLFLCYLFLLFHSWGLKSDIEKLVSKINELKAKIDELD